MSAVQAAEDDVRMSPLYIIADEAKRISELPFEEHDAEMRASAARTGLSLGSLQRAVERMYFYKVQEVKATQAATA